MPFLEVVIPCQPECHEVLIAELSAVHYDSFLEDELRLLAYVEETLYKEESLLPILEKHLGQSPQYTVKIMEDKNWNEEWEKNFQPVIVSDDCVVRASFHQLEKPVKYDLVINPKMSFGTGHHETTFMMLTQQLNIDHVGKTVLDAGSGTGVLAVMASRKGAREVEAFDIEDWAFENLQENIKLNNCGNILAYMGTVQTVPLKNQQFDILLANINKNVLLGDMAAFSKKLVPGGHLLLSGFYEEDKADMMAAAKLEGFSLVQEMSRNRWASLLFVKTK